MSNIEARKCAVISYHQVRKSRQAALQTMFLDTLAMLG